MVKKFRKEIKKLEREQLENVAVHYYLMDKIGQLVTYVILICVVTIATHLIVTNMIQRECPTFKERNNISAHCDNYGV
jgi:uncharacterized membrane protein